MNLSKALRIELLVISAIVISSISLWLLETHLKYWVFIIEVALILSLFLLSGNVRVTLRFNSSPHILQFFNLLVLLLAASLSVLTILRISNFFTFIHVVVISFFALGYVSLQLLNFYPSKSQVEWLVLSFWTSIPINCMLFSLTLILPIERRDLALSAFYLAFIFLSLAIGRRGRSSTTVKYERSVAIPLGKPLTLAVVIAFFILSVAATYPKMAHVPGLDIVRHYSSSLQLNTSPEEYYSPYPWFNFQWASLQLFHNSSLEVFQAVLAYLSVMSILSFYVMTETYLSDLDDKLPALSTAFWTLFSGFGWVHFLSLKLSAERQPDYFTLLGRASDSSYWDVSYGQGPWIWLWFRPLTLGVTGVFILLYLLKRNEIKHGCFLALTSLTVLSLGMNHFSELVFCVALFLVLCLVNSDAKLRLKDAFTASLIGLLSLAIVLALHPLIGVNVAIPMLGLGLLIVASALGLLVANLERRISKSRLLGLDMSTYVYYAMMGLTALWLATLLYWLVSAESFHVSLVSSVLGVPWMLYPTLLGVCGLFALAGSYYALHRYSKHPVVVFTIMFIFGIVYGRLLTYVNVSYIDIGYWERRIIPITFSASAVLASLSFPHVLDRLKSRHLLLTLLLSLLVFSGLTSTALTIEHQALATSRVKLTSSELSDIQYLGKASPNSYLLTLSPRSLLVSEYVPFAWRIDYFRHHIWPAKSPELVLNTLSSTGHPSVIYLTEKDLTQLSKPPYFDGYVVQHLLKVTPKLYKGTKATISRLPRIAAPAEDSNVVLVLPEGELDPTYLYAFDIMSLTGYNYTTALISDFQTLNRASVIMAPSETLAIEVLKLKKMLGLPVEQLVILNLDGYYGELAEAYPIVNASLASRFRYAETNIDYLNLYPVIEVFKDGATPFNSVVGNITRKALGDLPNYKFRKEAINTGSTAAFEKAELQGHVRMNFESFILYNKENSDLEIIVNRTVTSMPQNALFISPVEFDEATLTANFIEITPGKGFYINITANNAMLTLSGPSTAIAISHENGSLSVWRGNPTTIKVESAELSLRKPMISVKGNGLFKSFYAYHELHQRVRSLGDDCEIRGCFSFIGAYGDAYSIVKNFDFQGDVKLSTGLYTFDELKSLMEMSPYLILAAAIMVVFSFSMTTIKAREKQYE